ncbi:hypothetical protein BH24ACT10_BH24ACT10_04350 [soil metagenome]
MEKRAARKPEQVNAAGEDVLPHLPGADVEALVAQFSKQFGMDEVDLAEVELRGVGGDSAAMLHRDAGMGVTLNSQSRQQRDLFHDSLAEAVLLVAAHRYYGGLAVSHDSIVPCHGAALDANC